MTPVLFEKGLFFRGKLLVLLRLIYNPSKYVVHDGQLDKNRVTMIGPTYKSVVKPLPRGNPKYQMLNSGRKKNGDILYHCSSQKTNPYRRPKPFVEWMKCSEGSFAEPLNRK